MTTTLAPRVTAGTLHAHPDTVNWLIHDTEPPRPLPDAILTHEAPNRTTWLLPGESGGYVLTWTDHEGYDATECYADLPVALLRTAAVATGAPLTETPSAFARRARAFLADAVTQAPAAPARECPDVASVKCLLCGTVVNDPTGIDLWNGYGVGPCGHEASRTLWTTYAGTWQIIVDGAVVASSSNR